MGSRACRNLHKVPLSPQPAQGPALADALRLCADSLVGGAVKPRPLPLGGGTAHRGRYLFPRFFLCFFDFFFDFLSSFSSGCASAFCFSSFLSAASA